METNPYYEAAVNHMAVQVQCLEDLIGRSLTPNEKDNLHEFVYSLDPSIQAEFESRAGNLL